MKRILLVILLSIATINCFPQSEQIAKEKLIQDDDVCYIERIGNGTTVMIIQNNTAVKKHIRDSFLAGQEIQWENELQYIKAYDQTAKVGVKICAKAFYDNKQIKTLRDYCVYTQSTDTKKVGSNMQTMLSRKFYMIEGELRIKCFLPLNENNYYVAKDLLGTAEFPVQYDDETNELVFLKDYLIQQGVTLGKEYNRFHLEYIHNGQSVAESSTDKFEFMYIPY